MKSVVDLFVLKDRTAIFWFTMACVSIVCSALFVQRMIAAIRNKPQYVIMDASGVYYLAPSVEFEKAKDLHEAQTRLAMETLYTRDYARGDEPMLFGNRVKKLFMPTAIRQIQDEFLTPDAKPFKEQKVHQTVEIEEAGIYKNKIDPRGQAITYAKGKLYRQGTLKGQEKTDVYTVQAFFFWRINAKMADNGAFPTVCYKIQASDPKKQTP
jgi:hypothetical protein